MGRDVSICWTKPKPGVSPKKGAGIENTEPDAHLKRILPSWSPRGHRISLPFKRAAAGEPTQKQLRVDSMDLTRVLNHTEARQVTASVKREAGPRKIDLRRALKKTDSKKDIDFYCVNFEVHSELENSVLENAVTGMRFGQLMHGGAADNAKTLSCVFFQLRSGHQLKAVAVAIPEKIAS